MRRHLTEENASEVYRRVSLRGTKFKGVLKRKFNRVAIE